jgi:hypothetical protein
MQVEMAARLISAILAAVRSSIYCASAFRLRERLGSQAPSVGGLLGRRSIPLFCGVQSYLNRALGGLDGDLLVRREACHLSGRTDVRNPLPAESMLCLQQLISDALMLHGADNKRRVPIATVLWLGSKMALSFPGSCASVWPTRW